VELIVSPLSVSFFFPRWVFAFRPRPPTQLVASPPKDNDIAVLSNSLSSVSYLMLDELVFSSEFAFFFAPQDSPRVFQAIRTAYPGGFTSFVFFGPCFSLF